MTSGNVNNMSSRTSFRLAWSVVFRFFVLQLLISGLN